MSARLCIYVRDRQHPADLYDSSTHFFAVSIHEVGSGGPLHWKGTNYDWLWLPFAGELNRVAGEFEVPAGTYLVKGYAMCSNVVTHMAWVQVADGQLAAVNLVPTSVVFCLHAARLGVRLGTIRQEGKDIPLAKLAPAETEAFEKALGALLQKLPKEPGGAQLMELEEVQKRLRETPKHE